MDLCPKPLFLCQLEWMPVRLKKQQDEQRPRVGTFMQMAIVLIERRFSLSPACGKQQRG